MKRKTVSILIIALFILSVFSGCNDKLTRGDFEYIFYGEGDKREADIVGLTPDGMKKKILVVPKKINGYPVVAIWRRSITGYFQTIWETDQLEILYIPCKLQIFGNTFLKCPNLNKIFVLNFEEDTTWGDYNFDFYYTSISIYIYRYYYISNMQKSTIKPANVTYYYNYDDSPNNGCYWLDNLEDGEKISFIPEEPIREGYVFAGWYKEPECINKWDFENDIIYASKDDFYENKLYAKWE
ncbi:MAG TPA: InlB B-repeat-containing protein [Clostridia bacterium]